MKHLVILAAVLASASSIGCAGAVPYAQGTTPVVVAGDHPCAMRAEAGAIWASAGVWAAPRRAWTMPAHGAVDQLTVDPVSGRAGYVVTFRQGGVVWSGQLDASRAARGGLRAGAPLASETPAMGATAQR